MNTIVTDGLAGDAPVRQFTTKRLIGVGKDSSVQEACRIMVDFGISSLVVLGEQERVVGFLTQKDVITRVVAENRPASVQVEDVMSKDPIRIDIDTPVSKVLNAMAKQQITHMLIEEDGEVRGIFTLKDYHDYQRQRLTTTISSG